MKSVKKPLTILVTGASKGIGFDLAQRLQKGGHRVIGVARSQPIEPYTFTFLSCDLTDKEALAKLPDALKKVSPQLDVVIQNAGLGYGGSVEELPDDAFEKTMALNVLAIDRLNRLLLPMLKQTRGYIIHVGSVAGDLAIPFQTFYSASKAALERYSEGLRNELKPFGVRVVTIKPGDTQSQFSANRVTVYRKESPYYERIQRSIQRMEADEKSGMPTHSVFRVVKKLLMKKNPPVSVTIGFSYQFLQCLNRILPKKFVHFILYQLYGK
jgi:short-subunit dehydrogenase